MSVFIVFFYKFVNMGKVKRDVAITWGLTFLRRDIWNERKVNFFRLSTTSVSSQRTLPLRWVDAWSVPGPSTTTKMKKCAV